MVSSAHHVELLPLSGIVLSDLSDIGLPEDKSKQDRFTSQIGVTFLPAKLFVALSASMRPPLAASTIWLQKKSH